MLAIPPFSLHLANRLSSLALLALLALPWQTACLDGNADNADEHSDQDKIYGGRNAYPGEFPSIISLKTDDGLVISCTGTLIAPQIVLTAAHCVKYLNHTNPVGFYAIRGELNVNKPGLIGDYRAVNKIIAHDNFSAKPYELSGANWEYDVALLRLATPFVGATTIPLAREAAVSAPGQHIEQVGYGDNDDASGPRHGILRVLDNTITQCPSRYTMGGAPPNSKVNEDAFVCALDLPEGSRSGDSGGPVFATDAAGEYVQIGVTSFGGTSPKDEGEILYGFNVQLDSLRSWIDLESTRLTLLF